MIINVKLQRSVYSLRFRIPVLHFHFCPLPLSPSYLSRFLQFHTKKKTIMHYTLVKSLSFSLAYIYQIEEKKTHIAPSYKRFQIFLGKGAAFEKTKHTKEKRTNLNITLPKHFWIVIGSIYFQKDHHLHNQLIF